MTTHVLRGSWLFQRALRRSALGLVLVSLLFITSAAHAQGTSGSLPDPMSSRDLDRIMGQLELDDAQRRVAETCHEQYIEEFKRLREGEIESYLEKMNAMQGRMPKRKELEDFLSGMEKLHAKIGRLDNQFFDQIMAVLRDDQQLTLTRLRMHRTRERHGGDMLMMVRMLVPAAAVDLSELYNTIRLTPDEKVMIQTSVMDYESKLTRATKDLSDSLLRMFLDIFEVIEAAGFDENAFMDPEQAQEAFNVMREAWGAISAKLMEKAMDISDLNRRSCKRIAEPLLLDHRERLIDMYYERAYPELPKSNLPALFRKALRHNDLDEEQWMNVSVLRDDYRRQEQRIYDDMADIQDMLRATRSPFDMGGMGGRPAPTDDEAVDKLAALTEKHEQLVARITEALEAHLGTDLRARVEQMEDPLLKEAANAPKDPMEEMMERFAAPEENRPTGEQAISVSEFRQTVRLLDLDEATAAVVEQLHAAYVERFTKEGGEAQAKAREAAGRLWTFDEATGTSRGPSVAQVNELHELRKNVSNVRREIDAEFFSNLMASVGDDPERQKQVERLRNIRTRASYSMGRDMWGWGFGGYLSQASNLDIAALCMEQQLLDEPNEALDAILSTYDADMLTVMQSRFQKGLESQHLMECSNAEIQAASQDGDTNVAAGVRYQQNMEAVSNEMNKASQHVANINRETIKAIKEALPEAEAMAFEKAYKRAAFPSVYRAVDAIDESIAKLRSLNSLTPSQRANVEELIADFTKKHNAVCDAMVALIDNASGDIRPFGAESYREYQRIESSMQKLMFEREELTARARRRVQDVLSDDQLAQLGGPFAKQPTATP